MARNIPLRSDKTRSGKSETGKRIVLIQLLTRRLRYIKRILNDKQRILEEILGTIQHNMRFEWAKENSAYMEQIAETKSGIMQEISSVYAQSIRLFGQKILFDWKELKAGTDLRIWISSMMVPPKNGRYSEVFT